MILSFVSIQIHRCTQLPKRHAASARYAIVNITTTSNAHTGTHSCTRSLWAQPTQPLYWPLVCRQNSHMCTMHDRDETCGAAQMIVPTKGRRPPKCRPSRIASGCPVHASYPHASASDATSTCLKHVQCSQSGCKFLMHDCQLLP